MDRTESIPVEFAFFVTSRMPRTTPWAHVYDEMCRIVQSRAFRGMGYAELAEAGVSLSILGVDRLGQLLDQAWERAGDASGAVPQRT